ncbi:hypothetical protein KP77_33820 [Jeotgalibacillus alimentarius]|uniref:DUF3278 domain-containing protein n=1 Tax=Jeotgalibacillus alimentarius TaxID=135826 RepID=A0A0C2V109_9BACL|nr:hypothetical protein [Jeotgalibacillus alimentarius]KIL42752.1 hypothetical protein KP77_33820 [Jeotgalibacillus alimentarius]
MKTWIGFLLPDDEYKEKKILIFLAEGAVLLFLSLVVMTLISRFMTLDAETVLLISMGTFVLYVGIRYITSGIEYTDVATENAYKKERKIILFRTFTFAFIFLISYIFIVEIPATIAEWFEITGLLTTAVLFMFVSSYVSLKRSYHKNKELI